MSQQAEQFDAVLMYSEDDRDQALRLREIIQRFLVLDDGHHPSICILDGGQNLAYIASRFDHCAEALRRSTYSLLLITANFCSDTWSLIQRDEALLETINDPMKKWCLVPLLTTAKKDMNYVLPFGLGAIKGVDISKILACRKSLIDVDVDRIGQKDVDASCLRQLNQLFDTRLHLKLGRIADEERKIREQQETERRRMDAVRCSLLDVICTSSTELRHPVEAKSAVKAGKFSIVQGERLCASTSSCTMPVVESDLCIDGEDREMVGPVDGCEAEDQRCANESQQTESSTETAVVDGVCTLHTRCSSVSDRSTSGYERRGDISAIGDIYESVNPETGVPQAAGQACVTHRTDTMKLFSNRSIATGSEEGHQLASDADPITADLEREYQSPTEVDLEGTSVDVESARLEGNLTDDTVSDGGNISLNRRPDITDDISEPSYSGEPTPNQNDAFNIRNICRLH